jgi:Ca2+-binding EF-hand superfamily protein
MRPGEWILRPIRNVLLAVAAGLITPPMVYDQPASCAGADATSRPANVQMSPPKNHADVESLKTKLGCSKEEWKVVEPLLRKVAAERLAIQTMNLQSQENGRGFGFGFDDRRPGGGFGNDSFEGPAGAGGFGPGNFMAKALLTQADKNGDGVLSRQEFVALADEWFDKLDPQKTAKVSREQFIEHAQELLPPPGGFGGPGGGRGGPGPGSFIGTALFAAISSGNDQPLARTDFRSSFDKWFTRWDADKSGTIDENKLREGLNSILPSPRFGPGGPPGMGPRPDAPPRGGPDEPSRAASGGQPAPDRDNRGGRMNVPNSTGGPPGRGAEDNAVARAMRDLQETLADSKSTPELIGEKIAAVRAARKRANAELQAALRQLAELLTPDQQAVLISLGYLE